jgi:hypothetical protein
MANAIDVHSHLQPSLPSEPDVGRARTREARLEVAAAEGGETTTDVGRARTREARLELSTPTCECVDPATKDRCGKRATRAIFWGGDDTPTPACVECARYNVSLSQEHKCPGHVKIIPLDTTHLH